MIEISLKANIKYIYIYFIKKKKERKKNKFIY